MAQLPQAISDETVALTPSVGAALEFLIAKRNPWRRESMSIMPKLQHRVAYRRKILDRSISPLLCPTDRVLHTLLQYVQRVNGHMCLVRAGTRRKPAIATSTTRTSSVACFAALDR